MKDPEQNIGSDWGLERVRQGIEALLFVASEPLTEAQLSDIIGVSRNVITAALADLEKEYTGHGIYPRQIAGGWQFVSAPEHSVLIEKLYRPKAQQLSNAAMETLAIIAYRQPITRAEISEIRGVDCDGVVGTLMDKRLICETGRVEGAGHAILYGTSPQFLEFFGLNSLRDLPELAENPVPTDITL